LLTIFALRRQLNFEEEKRERERLSRGAIKANKAPNKFMLIKAAEVSEVTELGSGRIEE
jgi:hypothetical protein